MALLDSTIGGFLGTLSTLDDKSEVKDPEVLRLQAFIRKLYQIKTGSELEELLPKLTLEMTNRLNSPLIDGLYAAYYGVRPTPGIVQPPEAKALTMNCYEIKVRLEINGVMTEINTGTTRRSGFFEEELTKKLVAIGSYPETLRYLLTQFRLSGVDYILNAVCYRENLEVLLTWKDPQTESSYTFMTLKMLLAKACHLGLIDSQKYLFQVLRERGFKDREVPHSILVEDLPTIDSRSLSLLLEEVEATSPAETRWNLLPLRRYTEVPPQNWEVLLDFVTPLDLALKASRYGLEKWLLSIFRGILDPQSKVLSSFVNRLQIPHSSLNRVLVRAAAFEHTLETVKLLVAKGANPRPVRRIFSETPLGKALYVGDPEVVEFLLDAGANFPDWFVIDFTEWSEEDKPFTGLCEKLYIVYRESVRKGHHEANLQRSVFTRKVSFYLYHLLEITDQETEPKKGTLRGEIQEQRRNLLRSQIAELRRCIEFLFQARAVSADWTCFDRPMEREAKIPFPPKPMDPDMFNILVREALDWKREIVEEYDSLLKDQVIFRLRQRKYDIGSLRFLAEPPWLVEG